jgi:hypothetical protein
LLTDSKDSITFRTDTELIVRKPGKLNILITRLSSTHGNINAIGQIVSQPSQFHSVYVRYNYTQLVLPEGDNRETSVSVPVIGETFDKTARNNMGDLGAFVVVPDMAGIEAAVTALKSVWGDIPVHDNSGVYIDHRKAV